MARRRRTRLITLPRPFVGEVGAGAGYLPQEGHQELVSGLQAAARNPYRRNHCGRGNRGLHQPSMQPTLNPGDFVLVVDRDDRDVTSGQAHDATDPLTILE